MTTGTRERQAIRRSSNVPAYNQLAQILEQQIAALTEEERTRALPSEGDLSRKFGLSRITVRHALKKLEAKGLVYSAQGRGSFPTMPRVSGISGFHSFTSEVRRNGQEPSTRILAAAEVDGLPEAVTEKLSVTEYENGPQVFLRRLRLIDGVPIAIEDAWLPKSLFPDLAPADFNDESLYVLLADRWGVEPAWTDALIEPNRASAEVSRLLDIGSDDPVLVAWRVTVTAEDKVFERVRSIYRTGFSLRIARYRLG
ncbi:GntR family transcriptional regulator [Paracoccus liaowanqingii]|uniref:GntR family transcriptional regulator n=1 Tax=Paracoccus liaowanqingii TaxID=2560053 RepID=A0A4Z1CL78_9RHOB|nr:GntR family transcriptional regulator [Paracoccus liaowanqingii]TGN57472.1 GntR family transcriptional regulator [Paracoccus liaowanqingii]